MVSKSTCRVASEFTSTPVTICEILYCIGTKNLKTQTSFQLTVPWQNYRKSCSFYWNSRQLWSQIIRYQKIAFYMGRYLKICIEQQNGGYWRWLPTIFKNYQNLSFKFSNIFFCQASNLKWKQFLLHFLYTLKVRITKCVIKYIFF